MSSTAHDMSSTEAAPHRTHITTQHNIGSTSRHHMTNMGVFDMYMEPAHPRSMHFGMHMHMPMPRKQHAFVLRCAPVTDANDMSPRHGPETATDVHT